MGENAAGSGGIFAMGVKNGLKKINVNKELIQRQLQNKKTVVAVYLVLRALVLLVMIAQLLKGNYENVYICLLTLVLFTMPSILGRRLHLELPDTLEIVILLFIFAAEILGEIHEYYLRIPFWDTILHTLNGFLFAAIGFCLVDMLNENKKAGLSMTPVYMAVTAFCFSMTIGVLWEFFEWAMDTFFALDMQKDTVLTAFQSVKLDPGGANAAYPLRDIVDTIVVFGDGTSQSLGVGGYLDVGLNDTMKDLLVNLIGAIVFSIIGYFYVKTRGKGRIAKHFIPTVVEREPEQKTLVQKEIE